MKIQKVTINIKVEVLHIDSAKAVILDVVSALSEENHHGQLIKEDGDTISWSTKYKTMEI